MTTPVGIRVPWGGSNCARCKYVGPSSEQCLNPNYIRTRYRGKEPGDARFVDGKTGHVVTDPQEFCCNFYDYTQLMRGT